MQGLRAHRALAYSLENGNAPAPAWRCVALLEPAAWRNLGLCYEPAAIQAGVFSSTRCKGRTRRSRRTGTWTVQWRLVKIPDSVTVSVGSSTLVDFAKQQVGQ